MSKREKKLAGTNIATIDAKKAKTESVPIYRSPLCDVVEPPSHKMRCTWNRINDKNQVNPHRIVDWKHPTKVYPNILSVIGNTPLVKLNKIPQAEGIKANIYVKCEYVNPGGSVKDRIGFRMVEDAEVQGLLKPGSTIIEPSSGNTGIGIALAAAVKGYRCIIVMSEKMSNEKVKTLQVLGAEIVRVPLNLDSNSPNGMFGITHKLHKEIPNSVILDQYSNPGNPLAHYDTTAEEIWDQCNKKVDAIVIGAGTGGTITGIGRKFKELSPKTLIVGGDPVGSILALPENLNDSSGNFYEVEGIGYDFVPTVLDRSVVNKWIKTTDKESLLMARRLIKEEGLLCGTSSGAAVAVAMQVAKNFQENQTVVVILPDSIRNYITKFVTDQWMEARGFLPCNNTHNFSWWDEKVTQLQLKPIQTVKSSTGCDKVLDLMDEHNTDTIVVIDNRKSVVGVLTRQHILISLNSKKIQFKDTIEPIIARVYSKLEHTANLGLISRVLEVESYVLIVETKPNDDDGNPVEVPIAVVTPKDLLRYTATRV